MNFIRRLFHRHNFFPTSEHRYILGDLELTDTETFSCEVLGEVYIEQCNSCGAKRLKGYINRELVFTKIETLHSRPGYYNFATVTTTPPQKCA